jgi:hypothetical protein
MTQPPKNVVIESIPWEVKFLERHILWRDSDMDLLGECRHSTSELRVLTPMSGIRAALVLLHEATHAIEYEHGLDLSEAQVRTISRGFFALIRDNKELIDFIQNAATTVETFPKSEVIETKDADHPSIPSPNPDQWAMDRPRSGSIFRVRRV